MKAGERYSVSQNRPVMSMCECALGMSRMHSLQLQHVTVSSTLTLGALSQRSAL